MAEDKNECKRHKCTEKVPDDRPKYCSAKCRNKEITSPYARR